ncbi:hypothetical protein D3C75_473200 [compost metagenome]
MNSAFTSLLNEKIELFIHSFSMASRRTFADEETGQLIHAGEFGTYREAILRDFLRLCIPVRLDSGTGFLISSEGTISTQIDIIIYDKSAIPRIESIEHQRFFPVEGVCAIGEVKSKLSKSELKKALNKLAKAKATLDELSTTTPIYRDQILSQIPFSRERNEYDRPISFLICEKFDFNTDSLHSEISSFYETDTKTHHKHNMILSIADGLLLYVDECNRPWLYPTQRDRPIKNRFVVPHSNPLTHFHLFCSYMSHGVGSATTIAPEMVKYIPQTETAYNYDS